MNAELHNDLDALATHLPTTVSGTALAAGIERGVDCRRILCQTTDRRLAPCRSFFSRLMDISTL